VSGTGRLMTGKLWALVVVAVLVFGAAVAGVTYYLTSGDSQHSTSTVGRCVYNPPDSDPLANAQAADAVAEADAKQDASLCPGSWEQVPRSQVKSH
jgi:hypothetical protein